jgi:hypothetical protein
VAIPDGVLQARYNVLNSTNIGGVNIPLVFRFETFILGPDKELLPIGDTWGRVVDLSPTTEPQFVISPEKRFAVVDYRFRHPTKQVDLIEYTITNGVVPSASDPILQKIYQAKVTAAPYDLVYKNRSGIFFLFGVLILPPLIVTLFFAWRRLKKVNNKPKQNQQK